MGFPWGGGVLNAEWVEQYSCGCGDWIYLVLFVFSVVEWKAVCILDFLRVFFFGEWCGSKVLESEKPQSPRWSINWTWT